MAEKNLVDSFVSFIKTKTSTLFNDGGKASSPVEDMAKIDAPLAFYNAVSSKMAKSFRDDQWLDQASNAAAFNPVSGQVYSSINQVQLLMSDYTDPRWMSREDITKQGGQLVPNSVPTKILLDTTNPDLGFLDVFNAEQTTGLTPITQTELNPDKGIEKIEKIVDQLGINLYHDSSSLSIRAYYNAEKDFIELPEKGEISNAFYCALAIHQLAHATSHPSRLNRNEGEFGTEDYNREELRVELAARLISQELGVQHMPDMHNFRSSWADLVERDPIAVMSVFHDAEKIKDVVLEGGRLQGHTVSPEGAPVRAATKATLLNDYQRNIADILIEQLKKGTAPWQKPWTAEGGGVPFNPTTGDKVYRGGNAIALMMRGYEDPRWMTYKQAQRIGVQVKKGEKATSIIYWKYEEERPKKNEDGSLVLDANGKKVMETIKLAYPKPFIANVFNAQQIDGLEAYRKPPLLWNPLEKAENILSKSGAQIEHRAQNRAYYSSSTDTIVLPLREQFASNEQYYATALHELGHWTGHTTRLDRDVANPFGSEAYAKEELIAEISSMMLCDQLGVLHKTIDNHAAYVESWIKALTDDPAVLFRSATAAENSVEFLMTQVQEQKQEHERSTTVEAHTQDVERKAPHIVDGKREYLYVPYAERIEAKAAGARWDSIAKSWYAAENANHEKLARWKNNVATNTPKDPRASFIEALTSMGGVVTGEHPIMDGKPHRIADVNDRAGQAACFYVAHMDGIRPAGYIKNNRTGEEMRWKAEGQLPSIKDQEAVRQQCEAKRQAVAKELRDQHQRAAQRVTETLLTLAKVTEATPYHTAKGIAVHEGVHLGKDGTTLCVPAQDIAGTVWTMQYINEDSTKRFAKAARKEGCFHVIGGAEQLAKANALVISEGYATAATVAESLNCVAVAAFDSGNIMSVATALHEKYPDKALIIAGDDDKHTVKNPGRSHAEAAAQAVGGIAVFPVFAPSEKGREFTDFNDLAQKSQLGADAVKRQLQPIVEKAIVQQNTRQLHKQEQQHEQHKGRSLSR